MSDGEGLVIVYTGNGKGKSRSQSPQRTYQGMNYGKWGSKGKDWVKEERPNIDADYIPVKGKSTWQPWAPTGKDSTGKGKGSKARAAAR